MIRGLLSGLGLSLLLAAAAGATTEAPALRKGVLTVFAGDYKADFREAAAWTLGNMFYQGKLILNYTGANQMVVNMKRPDQASAEAWVGSSHGGEVIRSVVLKVDGKSYPLDESFAAPGGEKYQLVKESEIGPFLVMTETTVSAEGVRQDISIKEKEAADETRYLYVFMHCWNPSLKEWVAFLPDGSEIAETFPLERTNLLKQDITALALYSPEDGVGAVMRYPEAYQGEPGHSNFLAVWPDRHNKHYLRMSPGQVAGKTFSADIQGFSTSEENWKAEAKRLARPDEKTAP